MQLSRSLAPHSGSKRCATDQVKVPAIAAPLLQNPAEVCYAEGGPLGKASDGSGPSHSLKRPLEGPVSGAKASGTLADNIRGMRIVTRPQRATLPIILGFLIETITVSSTTT